MEPSPLADAMEVKVFILFWNLAGIGNLRPRPGFFSEGPDGKSPPFSRNRLGGVVEKIVQDPLDHHGRTADGQRRFQPPLNQLDVPSLQFSQGFGVDQEPPVQYLAQV